MAAIIKAKPDVEDAVAQNVAATTNNGLKIEEEPVENFMKKEMFIELYEQMTSCTSVPNETEPMIEAAPPAVVTNIKQETTDDDEQISRDASSTTNQSVRPTNRPPLPVTTNIKQEQVEDAEMVNAEPKNEHMAPDASIANEPPLPVAATKVKQEPVEYAERWESQHEQTVVVASSTTNELTTLPMTYLTTIQSSNNESGGCDPNVAKRRRIGWNAQEGDSMKNGQDKVHHLSERRTIRLPPLANTVVASEVMTVSGLCLARKYASAPLPIKFSTGVECSSGGQASVTLTTQRTSRGISALCVRVVKRSL